MVTPKCVIAFIVSTVQACVNAGIGPEFSLIMQILNHQNHVAYGNNIITHTFWMSANFAIVRIKTSASNGLAKCAS
jgi:hypothetical protein